MFCAYTRPRYQVSVSSGSETIATSDLKGSSSRHLIEYMKICEY